MNKVIIVTNIQWDAPSGVKLPDTIVVDAPSEEMVSEVALNGYAEELTELISSEYSVKGYSASVEGGDWTNLGDVNFIAYGGCLVRPHWTKEELEKSSNPEALRDMYDVLYVITPDSSGLEDIWSARLYCVDLGDITDEDINNIAYITGCEEIGGLSAKEVLTKGLLTPELLAKECVECLGGGHAAGSPSSYHAQYADAWELTTVTERELKLYMLSLGAEEYI